ncbi:MAG: diguanylate cyclase [Chloroflexi bacterium]|nr:MAG: diguanylate cyclase [Chloroflexota bacterium]
MSSLAAPPSRLIVSVAIEGTAAGSLALAIALWLRASQLRRGMLALLAIASVAVSGLTVELASNPPSGVGIQSRIGRTPWLLLLGLLAAAAVTIRRLILEVRARKEELTRLSRTDHVAGIGNRRAWDEELQREIIRATREGSRFCVATLDLDGFRAYNLMRGHAGGDSLLKRTGQAWQDLLRAGDLIVRYHNDTFAALFRQCTIENAAAITERLRMAVPEEQTVSAGVVRWNCHERLETLMQRAEAALIQAKTSGPNRLKISALEPAYESAVATNWRAVVERVLEERSVVAVFQPIIDLKTAAVSGYEALARPHRQPRNNERRPDVQCRPADGTRARARLAVSARCAGRGHKPAHRLTPLRELQCEYPARPDSPRGPDAAGPGVG